MGKDNWLDVSLQRQTSSLEKKKRHTEVEDLEIDAFKVVRGASLVVQ